MRSATPFVTVMAGQPFTHAASLRTAAWCLLGLAAWPTPAHTAIALPLAGTVDSADAARIELDATIEVFASAASNRPPDGVITGRVFDPRHGHLGLSTALLGLHATSPRARAHLELWRGLTPQVIYGAETFAGVDWSLFRQANLGARLAGELWLEAGIFPSPIGWESSLARDNWLWSSAQLNYAMPFYLAGTRVTWTSPGGTTWELGAYGGWSRMQASAIPSTSVARAYGGGGTASWQVLVSTAPTRPDLSPGGLGGPRGWLAEAFYTSSMGPRWQVAFDANAGWEQWRMGTATGRATWVAGNAWARWHLGGPWRLAARVGAFHQTGDRLTRGGVTLDRLWWPAATVGEVAACAQWQAEGAPMLRGEVRYDVASDAVFATPSGAGATHRATATLGLVWSL